MRIHHKKLAYGVILQLLLVSTPGFGAEQTHTEDDLEEIVITAPFEESEAETVLPIGILSGEALREKVGNSLGDTLKNEIGVASASFGAGVGQPIIRGQSGNRVNILQNGIGLTDASNVSPDHANGVEPIIAERIEVIRGPSALLYGSGAIGGVINVIDGRIPERLVEQAEILIEQSHNSVNDENKTVVMFDSSHDNFGFHLDAFNRDANNVEVRGMAIDEAALKSLDELVEAQTGEFREDSDELANSNGFVANSYAESQGGTIGVSHVYDSGFFGFSIGESQSEYGLPPGFYEDPQDGSESQEFVRIQMHQTRYDFKGSHDFIDGWITNIKANIGFTDYLHKEIEIQTDGSKVIGTRFSNEGFEGRMTMSHIRVGNWEGVWGIQLTDTEFSAIGEEAFIPQSDLNSLAIFGVERYQRGNFTGELGIRIENNRVDPGSSCDSDKNSTSLSGSMLYEINSESNFLIGITRSERAPSVEELYSNISLSSCSRFSNDHDLVLHAATGLMEIGNPLLDKEISNNIELGFRRHDGPVTGEISAYYNEIDDYILLGISGEQAAQRPIANYLARDATFKGVEAEVSFNLVERNSSNVALSLFGDLVRADFDNGGDLPRIPPAKLGAELRFFGDNWSLHFHATRFWEQENVGELELETDGYTLVSLYADYHWSPGARTDINVFLKGDNLLDEEIRNHASFMKNFSPEQGRGFRIGIRLEY